MAKMGHNSKKEYISSVNDLTEEQRNEVRSYVKQISNCLQNISMEQEIMKDLTKNLSESVNMNKTTIRKLARTLFKKDYEELVEANKNFEEFYTGFALETLEE